MAPFVDYFVQRGYAFVIVDVRGSGASFGVRHSEFSSEEIRDGGAVVDWIVAQPWSNGRVGSTGVSYLGTTAELLLVNHNPAVKAVAPISSGYDFYADIDYPGGVENQYFNQGWGRLDQALDHADPTSLQKLGIKGGPCPVDADSDGTLLRAAIAEHAGNADVAATLAAAQFRDDTKAGLPEGWPSPYRRQDVIDAARTPLLALVGWADAGYAKGAIDRFLNTRSDLQRLVIAPVNHGLAYFFTPGVVAPTLSSFDSKAEILRFFDHYIAGLDNRYERGPRLRWFTTGANRWNAGETWPKPGRPADFCFAPGRLLQHPCARSKPTFEEFSPTADAQSGDLARWNSSLGGKPVVYAERSRLDAALMTYSSAPLADPLEFTGVPALTLDVANTAPDEDYFVYLEDVSPNGDAYYVTEGELRASHSKAGPAPYRTLGPSHSDLRQDRLTGLAGVRLRFDIALLPTSHRFAAGHRIRIAIAGSDTAHFNSPALAGQHWSIGQGGVHPSRLTLPAAQPLATLRRSQQ
jgi:hypothetical protein